MHILMTADTVGGVWSYAIELARALAPHGVQVTLATLGGQPSAQQRAQAAAVPGLTLHASDYRLEWMDDPWDDVAESGRWLQDLAAEARPDIVHLNGYAHGAQTWPAPALVVGHSCVCSWWEAVRGEHAPAQWRRYRVEVRRGLQRAAITVAPTMAMLNEIDRHYGPLRRTLAIANGIDLQRFQPEPKQPLVMAAGRVWDEAKNIAALAQVAPALTWPVAVAGSAAHPEGGSADLLGVRMLGQLSQPDLARWLGAAAIYVLPARYEPFGLSVLEAASASCALVLGDIPTLRELWEHNALFVPPSDHRALRRAITQLIEDRRLREELAASALQRAQHFSAERMAVRYLQLYRDLQQAAQPRSISIERAVGGSWKGN